MSHSLRVTALLLAPLLFTACKVGALVDDPDAAEEADAAPDLPDAPPGQPDAAPDLPDAADGTLIVIRAGDGAGMVLSSPAGIDCGAVCTAQYAPGTPVSITATAD